MKATVKNVRCKKMSVIQETTIKQLGRQGSDFFLYFLSIN